MNSEIHQIHATQQAQAASEPLSVVIVDDDVELCSLMSEYLVPHGYQCTAFHEGSSGLAAILKIHCDVVILDVMLPVLDGFEVLRRVRRASLVPVIMLTARTHTRDRIGGLNAGADDYLLKPFDPEELLARISAVLRRSGQTRPLEQEVKVGSIRLNTLSREVWNDDRAIRVTSIEFDILELLVRSAGRIVSRDEITAILHQRAATASERFVDVHISHLRRKLNPGGAQMIQTIRSAGYLFGGAE